MTGIVISRTEEFLVDIKKDAKRPALHDLEHWVICNTSEDDTPMQVVRKLKESGDFIIRHYDDYQPKTEIQRLNMFWAVPFTIALSPFKYVIYGDTGWSTRSRFGRWILRRTGEQY